MNTQDKKNGMTLTLVEAVETLSNIAELQVDHNLGIAEKHDLVVTDKPLTYHTVHWLHHQDAAETVSIVKETFRVILKYLQDFYKNDYSDIKNPEALENIKTVMVLVGEAAKKLDKYTALFFKKRPESVTELREYKKLQEFYQSHIARKIDEGTLSKWVVGLAQRKISPERKVVLQGPDHGQAKHVFIDLESVKKDTEYELFLLKKEDGTRFFSPRLIRNIKLISDFGDYIGQERSEDPLLSVEIWQDRGAFGASKQILKRVRGQIEDFFRVALQQGDNELVDTLNKGLIALMMAANPHNLSHNMPIKNCRNYFQDFQLFLRQCILSREYQKMMAYPPDKTNKLATGLLKLIHDLCFALYAGLIWSQELMGMVHALVQEAEEGLSSDHRKALRTAGTLGGRMAGEYAALAKLLKAHPHGPMNKILNNLEDGDYHSFDPLIQNNLPTLMYTLYMQDKSCPIARWPSMTHQEFIDKAALNGEFKAFLKACVDDATCNKALLFNLQDRVSWKEYSRCAAVEDLTNHDSFNKQIEVVTLSKDTEFYHQLAPYNQENRTDVFIRNFKQQLEDEHGGFLFPKWMEKDLNAFINKSMVEIQKVFFSDKNVLTREQRMDFIELFYIFLELKIIEMVNPDIVGFSCKDGLDVTAVASTELYIILKFLNQERLSENDREFIDLMVYGPCLLIRERILTPERFNRMVSVIKAIESTRAQFGHDGFTKVINEAFGKLYKKPILKAKVANL
jgi:hypothetical protein